MARRLSFTEAANELGVTTTAVSHQIRHLEAYLGFKLVERRPRDIVLTPAGQEMAPILRSAFDLMADAFAVLDRESEARVVRLTTTRAFAERWLFPRLARFLDGAPDFRVEIDTDEAIKDLSVENIDCAIRYGPVSALQPGAEHLLNDRFIAVVRADADELAGSLAEGRLLGFRWRNPEMKGPTWQRWFEERGLDLHNGRIIAFSDESAAIDALDHGLGILLCSKIMVDEGLKRGHLRQVPGPDMKGFPWSLHVSRPARHRKAVQLFCHWLREELATLGEDDD